MGPVEKRRGTCYNGAKTRRGEAGAVILAVCVDDRGGMRFHGRRQSRDRLQRADLLAFCRGKLWVDPTAAALFAGAEDRLRVDDACLERAGEGETCFAETPPLAPYGARLEGVLVYRWNRVYPADAWFDLDPAALGFVLAERREFPGTSHAIITRDYYTRRDP